MRNNIKFVIISLKRITYLLNNRSSLNYKATCKYYTLGLKRYSILIPTILFDLSYNYQEKNLSIALVKKILQNLTYRLSLIIHDIRHINILQTIHQDGLRHYNHRGYNE